MISDKCPFCGPNKGKGKLHFLFTAEELLNPVWFECGTITEPKWRKGSGCYERQIADLQRRLELWKAFGKFALEIFGYSVEPESSYQALKTAGEVE